MKMLICLILSSLFCSAFLPKNERRYFDSVSAVSSNPTPVSVFNKENEDAYGWKEIIPLRSDCAKVKEVLGISSCSFPETVCYLENETVSVTFSTTDAPCNAKSPANQWKVLRGTVLEVKVFLKKKLPIDSLIESKKVRFRKLVNDFLDETTFSSNEAGVSFTAVNGEVSSIIYFPPRKMHSLRCR